MKKVELIFVPTPGAGHLASTVEFVKRLIHHDDRILVTILSIEWHSSGFADAYSESLATLQPDRIQLIQLSRVDPPPLHLWTLAPEAFVYALIQSYIPHVRNAVTKILSMKSTSDSTRVAGLVLDLFCSPMVDVATELGLSSYIYLTSNASFFGLVLYLQALHRQNGSEFEYPNPENPNKDLGHLIPGFANPVPSCVLPSLMFNKHGSYTASVKIAERFKDAKGIVINTFEELETYALSCFVNGQNPPIYPVGPVIHLDNLPHPELDQLQRYRIMKWLDNKPESSVVFLCFGSHGCHGPPQVKEIALGLEQSGQRFLWSLRMPETPLNDAAGAVHYKNPEEMLPEGFLERIQERGMICRWAPQVEVLGHKAVGGFVSHCGWNSILESLWHGVPIVTWPIYAEQQLNAYMMKEVGLAVELRLDYRGGTSDIVKAEEIEEAVRQVMDAGSEVRKKVKEMAEMARKAVMNVTLEFAWSYIWKQARKKRLNRTVNGRRWRVELIFVPSPGVGRLASTVEFAKRLINHDHRIWVTVLCIQWFSSGFVDAYIEEPARIHFIQLPQKCCHKCCVHEIYFQLNPDVATDLGRPPRIFLTSNAATLGLILQNSLEFEFPKPETQNTDLGHLIPGFANPVPSCVLPSFLFNRDGGYTAFVKFAERFKDAKGIMINTFEELEPYALRCFSNAQNPPIYPVGPVIQLDGLPNPELNLVQHDKVMKRLDNQPESSEVFLCFGSMASHEPPQVKEIALALDQSGHKFLWSLHVPPPVDAAAGTVHFKNPEEMLPEGFLERIQERGMVCRWAPQVEVLGHNAVGGFVSHCGWNSILESLWFSVPIVTSPMFAEQQLNAYMMKGLGLAVVMRLDYRKGISDVVMADEIEKGVRQVMDAGSEVRKTVKKTEEMARKAVMNGGSSFNSIGRFIEDMIGNI
ncbi:hypothetical protein CXB51_012868 [Gossypium anomalum]|uniref:UDP-glycosyltransferases domain-containing protein n=1 Tax=Gossypium anomalum TaxID=47600 RepID=A0A8J5Z7I9_9ROSI|nr:hypothetical protein CXB51_012868 [Gossypium anomalum]